MKITNNYNLPIELVNAIDLEPHNKPNHYSVTTLLKGTKEVILTENHFDEITVDASECINTLLGTAMHKLFESSENSEKYFEYKLNDQAIITGRVDYYNEETFELKDYKTCSTYKFVHKEFDDWKKQLLMYWWLLKQNHKYVKSCTIVGLCKDWSLSELERAKKMGVDYPESAITTWTFEPSESEYITIDRFIKDKVCNIISAKARSENQVPECKGSERWNTGSKFACVIKSGGKARRVFDTKEEAETYIIQNPQLKIEERLGVDKKCSRYCPCREFCNYYKREVKLEYE